LTGVGTAFLKELRKGDWVYVYDNVQNKRLRVHVTDVISDDECSIDTGGSGGGGGGIPQDFGDAYMWVGRLTLPWVRNVDPDRYIAMFIRNAPTISSYTQAVDRAFFLVPGNTPFYEIRESLPYKKYSPALGRLDKLRISFRNADNTVYDFMGKDHVLMFKVVHFRQNIKYGDF
jgi:hypothetical protein